MDNQKQSIKNLIILYGTVLALLTILISVLKYVFGNYLERNVWESIFGFVLLIVLIAYPIKVFKNENNGFLNLSQSFKIGLGVAAVAGILSIAYFFVFANYIEPDFINQVLDAQMSEAIKQNPDISRDEIEKGKEMGKGFVMPMLYGGILIMNLFFGFIIALISGLVMKKE